jgi:hypothetical protein
MNEFVNKNLDYECWDIHNAFVDIFLKQFVITLKSKKDNVIFDESTRTYITIKKNGYVRGILDPKYFYIRVILYIHPFDKSDFNNFVCFGLMTNTNLSRVLIDRHHLKTLVIRSSVPDKAKTINLYDLEKSVAKKKIELNGEIEWNPYNGSKYLEMIQNPDFKLRWNLQ